MPDTDDHTADYRPHAGTITNSHHFRDFGGYWVDGHAVTVDHLVTPSGSVLVEINGRPLRRLPDHYPEVHDETGGVPARGF